MKLNKRYPRSIRSYLSFYVSASVLTMVTLLMFFLFYTSGISVKKYADDFARRNSRQDAQFETEMVIPDEALKSLASKYDAVFEKEYSVNFEEPDSKHSRIFKENKQIDLCELTAGSRPTNENEVMISLGYAEEHSIEVGDRIFAGQKERTVTGLFLRPDYLFMVENDTDTYKNVEDFFLAVLDEKTFNSSFEEPNVMYKVIYNDSSRENELRKEINSSYTTLSYLSSDANGRINYVYQEADTYIIMAWLLLITLPIIAVVLICIIISRKIIKEQKIIGTLSALGYKPRTIMLHYSIMAVIPGLIGGVLMSLVSLFIADWFGEFATASFEPIKPVFKVPAAIMIAGIIIPTVIYFIAAMLVTRKILKNNTVSLLSGSVGTKSASKKIFAKSKMKVRARFALRSVIGNPGRSFVIFLGIFLGSAIICFGMVYSDSMKSLADDPQPKIGSYKYRYYLSDFREGVYSDNTDVLINSSFESESGSIVNVIGADKDCKRLNLTEKSTNKTADLSEGWYISNLAAVMFDVDKGDEIKLKNSATLEEKTIKISGIIKNDYEIYVISTRENASKVTGIDADYYDCILSDDSISFEKGEVALILTDKSFKKQMDIVYDESTTNRITIILLGVVICIASIYVAINMMINEQAANISMLKVLGYKRKYIDTMVLRGNHILLIPGIVLGILGGVGIMKLFSVLLVEVLELILPVELTLKTVLFTIAVTCICYFGSLLILRRRVDNIDMIESLKDNRE